MSYQYSYLILGILFLIIWFILFIWRKDIRKEMLFMSLLFGFAGLLAEIAYINDWWTPLTITNTSIGIEDFLFGFVVGGIASVIYEEIFKKKIRIRRRTKKKKNRKDIRFVFFVLIFAILFFGSHYIFKTNTFISSLIAFGSGIIYIYIRRKDLIIDSLVSGFLLLGISLIVYSILELITPGWIQAFWHFKNIPNLIIFNVPIDDFIWYFFAGAFIGPLYEYWQEGKLINTKN
ncbi:hypothetical protein CMI39_03205 [Candidatus Pacearchaeota archaeon]|jgi:hypothetical protein|nr:hypothetical protein [Candidatus Pacearchaeota archaeon]|tara:strand:- start:1029 stop:1727 length:699 start_codon:yes stop_codon:yes gene_type:complete